MKSRYTNTLSLHRDKVLIVDDLIATGGTANAAAKLISKLGVKKIEFFMIIDLWNLEGSIFFI